MSQLLTYQIAKWRETFETAGSRGHKSLQWISLPVNLQSGGYQSMIDDFGKDAASMYGAWCALLSIAAGCPHRGVLASSKGEPLSLARIARMTCMPEEVFERLFAWATSEPIGWLETAKHEDCKVDEHPGNRPNDGGNTGQSDDDQPSASRQLVGDELVKSQQPVDDQPSTRLHNTTKHNTTSLMSETDVPDEQKDDEQDKLTRSDRKLAASIQQRVLKVAPKTKSPNIKKWANDIRLMREQDGYTHQEIWATFRWANNDRFWSPNVLSPSKLRKQFSTIDAKMRSEAGQVGPPSVRLGQPKKRRQAVAS